MITKSEFISTIRSIGEEYGDVIVKDITRTDRHYTGMYIDRIGAPTPVVDLDRMYNHYLETSDLDGCIDAIRDILTMSPDFSVDTDAIMNWSKAKTKLYLRLVGTVTDGICQVVEDLYLVPYLHVLDGNATAAMRITADLLDVWGITLDELFEAATENQETLRPAVIKTLIDVFGPMMAEDLGVTDETPFYIVSTESGNYGAGAILYRDVAEEIRERIGGDFYVLPSSVHETIVIPKEGNGEASALAEMVTMINCHDVREDDRLSDSVYTYDFTEGKLKKVS